MTMAIMNYKRMASRRMVEFSSSCFYFGFSFGLALGKQLGRSMRYIAQVRKSRTEGAVGRMNPFGLWGKRWI